MTTHYVAMAGIHGCMPQVCEVYDSIKDAAAAMADIHELGRDRRRALAADGYLELNCGRDGNEYIEIIPCDCNNAEDHEEN